VQALSSLGGPCMDGHTVECYW